MRIDANSDLVRTWKGQLRAALVASGGRENMAQWIEENTAHPRNPLKSWSFVAHEWQLGVLACQKNDTTVKKAAQTGCSELALRAALGLAVTRPSTTLIYVLPSAGFNNKFVGSRVDPVIDQSPALRGLINRQIDNLELKQIGSSFIHFAGASRTQQAISTPASTLLVDEYNFCDPDVVSSFSSRLEHCAPGEDLRWYFSTPTLPGYGISDRYEKGDQQVYLVRHDVCGEWVEVTPWDDIVVPGFDGVLRTFTKRDLEALQGGEEHAWVKCPSCGGVITHENLADPEKRQWVAKFPDRRKASFLVTPLDCPVVNPTTKIVRKVEHYPLHKDFLNYGLGLETQNAECMVLPEALERARTLAAVSPMEGGTGLVFGLDVGIVSHLVVGKRENGVLRVVWLERIRQDGENSLLLTMLQRLKQFGVVRGVVDAMPDISVPRALVANSWMGQVLAAYFVTGLGPKTLDLSSINEEDGTIKIARTRAIDEMVREINSGGVHFPSEHPELGLFMQHLLRLRRVSEPGLEGQEKAKWISTSDEDHFALAMLYCYMAARSMSDDKNFSLPIGVISGSNLISRLRLKRA